MILQMKRNSVIWKVDRRIERMRAGQLGGDLRSPGERQVEVVMGLHIGRQIQEISGREI
jgi:hypothetical protein